jgi:RNA polymerase sigma factor (sigma-70 family)
MSPWISTRLLATQSDQRLAELARRGHERAFEAVVERYRRPLLRYCSRMGLSDGRAEDVLQHALLQAWLALERQAEVRELRPWLYRIVHNTAVNALRSSRDDQRLALDGASLPAVASSESDVDRRIAVRDALSGVAALPRMQREAIIMSAFAGRSHEEVADELGITDGAVRGLLYRARATLRAAAAAITPQPLIGWACGIGAGQTTERLAELSAPVGLAGMTGVLAKGAAMAVTAAVLVGGAAVGPLEQHPSRRTSQGVASAEVGSISAAPLMASAQDASSAAARLPSSGASAILGAGARPASHSELNRRRRGSHAGSAHELRALAPTLTLPRTQDASSDRTSSGDGGTTVRGPSSDGAITPSSGSTNGMREVDGSGRSPQPAAESNAAPSAEPSLSSAAPSAGSDGSDRTTDASSGSGGEPTRSKDGPTQATALAPEASSGH